MNHTNESLAVYAANCMNVTGSMGSESDKCSLIIGGQPILGLDHSERSNYEGTTAHEGDWQLNQRMLEAAPIGAIVWNEWACNWAGHEADSGTQQWRKTGADCWELVQ